MAIKSDQHVAWTSMFGQTFVGTLVCEGFFGSHDVRRVDGGLCTVESSRLRPATLDEVDDNIDYFVEGLFARVQRTGKA